MLVENNANSIALYFPVCSDTSGVVAPEANVAEEQILKAKEIVSECRVFLLHTSVRDNKNITSSDAAARDGLVKLTCTLVPPQYFPVLIPEAAEANHPDNPALDSPAGFLG